MKCDFKLIFKITKKITRRNLRRILVSLILMYLLYVFGFTSIIYSLIDPINKQASPSSITNIYIDSDDDFDKYSFPGNGSKNNPYIIENYTIYGSQSKPVVVEIKNTSKNFIIKNCSIIFGQIGFLISNVSEGSAEITNCSLSAFKNSSIYLHNTDNIKVSYNSIANSNNGIVCKDCFSANISYNYLISCNFFFDCNLTSLVSHIVTENYVNNEKVEYLVSLKNDIISANELGQIILVNCSQVYIQEEYIDFEINIHYCFNCTIMNNDFYFHDSRLEVTNSNTIEIINNDFTDCLKAIKFINSQNCLVFDNLLNYCHNGIFLYKSAEIRISNNNITQSRFVDSIGVGSGIFLENSHNTLIQNNIIQSCGESAINITYSPDVRIIGNSIINNFIGIYLENQEKGISYSSYGAYIFLNDIIKNKLYGIYSKNCKNLHLIGNNIRNNSYLGCFIEESKSFLVESNICLENNNNGFLVKKSKQIHFQYNRIKMNKYNGLFLMNSSYSIISYNYFEENKEYGLLLDYKSSENTIHHNHFLYNNFAGSSQAKDDGSSNFWYLEDIKQGNYWSDHEQGDDFYQIDGNANSKDLYPLSDEINETKSREINFQIHILVLFVIVLGIYYFHYKRRIRY